MSEFDQFGSAHDGTFDRNACHDDLDSLVGVVSLLRRAAHIGISSVIHSSNDLNRDDRLV